MTLVGCVHQFAVEDTCGHPLEAYEFTAVVTGSCDGAEFPAVNVVINNVTGGYAAPAQEWPDIKGSVTVVEGTPFWELAELDFRCVGGAVEPLDARLSVVLPPMQTRGRVTCHPDRRGNPGRCYADNQPIDCTVTVLAF